MGYKQYMAENKILFNFVLIFFLVFLCTGFTPFQQQDIQFTKLYKTFQLNTKQFFFLNVLK